MSEKYNGAKKTPEIKISSQRRQFDVLENERAELSGYLATLKNERNEVNEKYPLSVSEFPDQKDRPYFREKKLQLIKIQTAMIAIQKDINSIDKKLDKLFARAWTEAQSENEIRTFRASLISELPVFKQQLDAMYTLMSSITDDSRANREVSEIVNYMNVIFKDIQKLCKSKEFLRTEYNKIDELRKEFVIQSQRVREKIARAIAYNNKTEREE